mmetsp:Transcript_22338/g.52607  ORF Transcript_22338/g.52607 Transcript_22338/m.52607 type:complete len:85 (+) Transcript_22338:203-457(+)
MIKKSPAQGQQAAQTKMMRTMMMITEMTLVAGEAAQTSAVQMKISRCIGCISEPVARPHGQPPTAGNWKHFSTPMVPAAKNFRR